MKEIEKLRNKLNYENKSEFRKFFYAWRFAIKNLGIRAIFRFPHIWYQLYKKIHGK